MIYLYLKALNMLEKLEKLEVEAKFKGWSKVNEHVKVKSTNEKVEQFIVISHEIEVDIKKKRI
jgi:hypothetical protein